MRRLTWVPIILLLSADAAAADPINIDVIKARYSTSVSVSYADTSTWENPAPVESLSRTRTSGQPLSDAMYIYDLVDTTKDWGATANASMFSASVTTTAYNPFEDPGLGFNSRALATATSSITFRPQTSGDADLGLAFYILEDALYYTRTDFSLYDVTAGQMLWSYGDGGVIARNQDLPWVGRPSEMTANLPLTTYLNASNTYLLTLSIKTDAWYDTEIAGISITGLRQTPEPTTLALGAVAALLALRRRRQRVLSS